MYVETVPNRNSKPTILIRKGFRQGHKVIKKTIANITDWPPHKIETLRKLLKDEPLVSPDDLFSIKRTLPHGHVEAVLATIKMLGLDSIIASKRSRERDIVVAMIAQRILAPCSKLQSTRLWHASTLAQELNVEHVDEDDLYLALDWLLARKSRIEAKLAKRHLQEDGLVLYDISSSYYEGRHCPLADFGHNRDGKKGKRIIVYGLMTDSDGKPVSVDVYPGHTSDSTTVPEQVQKLRKRFKLSRVVLVGDRGMLTQTQIDHLRQYPGLGWISALRTEAIRGLMTKDNLQPSLFDQQGLAEISSPDFPGERLIACFNPLLAEQRKRTREALLKATEQDLARLAKEVSRRTKSPLTAAEIGQKVGKRINRYKVGKHFKLNIESGRFSFERNQDSIRKEAALDGIYVVRTSESEARLSKEDTVRSYKSLSQVERAFRTLKGLDLLVRPIHHRLEDRVRAHIFLCMLAYYVEWHMRKALAPLLFDDEELDAQRWTRDPVLPAQPSKTANEKKRTKRTSGGFPVHSFSSLLNELATRCRIWCQFQSDTEAPLTIRHTDPTPFQRKAFELLGLFPVD